MRTYRPRKKALKKWLKSHNATTFSNKKFPEMTLEDLNEAVKVLRPKHDWNIGRAMFGVKVMPSNTHLLSGISS